MTWRVLLTGSRTWDEAALLRCVLARVWHPQAVLVHGACRTGADMLADACWGAWGGQIERHPAQWADRSRGHPAWVRNRRMVTLGASVCVAFIHRGSPGASGTVTLAREAGIPVWEFHKDPQGLLWTRDRGGELRRIELALAA